VLCKPIENVDEGSKKHKLPVEPPPKEPPNGVPLQRPTKLPKIYDVYNEIAGYKPVTQVKSRVFNLDTITLPPLKHKAERGNVVLAITKLQKNRVVKQKEVFEILFPNTAPPHDLGVQQERIQQACGDYTVFFFDIKSVWWCTEYFDGITAETVKRFCMDNHQQPHNMTREVVQKQLRMLSNEQGKRNCERYGIKCT
jgi:hypothetical protein